MNEIQKAIDELQSRVDQLRDLLKPWNSNIERLMGKGVDRLSIGQLLQVARLVSATQGAAQ